MAWRPCVCSGRCVPLVPGTAVVRCAPPLNWRAILLPDQPWADIRGMGNRLRHAYDQINTDIIWNVVSDDLPGLKADAVTALERLMDTPEPGEND